jgi:phosphomannomutase
MSVIRAFTALLATITFVSTTQAEPQRRAQSRASLPGTVSRVKWSEDGKSVYFTSEGKRYQFGLEEKKKSLFTGKESGTTNGEGNGGPIDPKVGYVRDSFVAMAQVLDAMAATGKSVAELKADIPAYEICKTKVAIDRDKISALYEKLQETYSDAQHGTMDGLRIDWSDKWMLVRPSNTEPIVRAIAEATTMDQAKELCDAAAEIAANL